MIGVAKPRSDTVATTMTAPEIADDLAERIRNGDYQPGARLDYDELTRLYGVKRWTIKRAMGLLRYAELVEERPGRGVFVRDHPE